MQENGYGTTGIAHSSPSTYRLNGTTQQRLHCWQLAGFKRDIALALFPFPHLAQTSHATGPRHHLSVWKRTGVTTGK